MAKIVLTLVKVKFRELHKARVMEENGYNFPDRANVLEHRNDAQNPLAVVYDMHNSVSLGSNERSLGSNENLDAQAHNKNSASANVKFLVMI